MATKIRLKRPSLESAPSVGAAQKNSLLYGEVLICPNTKKLVVGSGTADAYWELISEGEDSTYIKANNNAVKDSHIDWGSGTGQVDTDDMPEGASNLYFTNARADARIAAASLTTLSDVQAATTSEDGKVLTYNQGGSPVFQWEAVVSTDENVTTGILKTRLGELTGTIDIGDGSSTTVVKGNLQVDGNTTSLNTSEMTVDDINITLANNSTTVANSSLAGITIAGTDEIMGNNSEARFYYAHNANFPFGSGTTETFLINRPLQIVGAGGVSKLEIVSSAGSNATLTMNQVGGGGAVTVITNGNWTGNNIAENQIAGANFTQWDAAYTHSQTSHAPANATAGATWGVDLNSIPSDIVYDSDFTSDGILQRDSAGTYSSLPYLGGLNLKGLHNSATPAGTPGQLLTSQGSGGFSWSTVGSGSGEIAAGDHNHDADYSAVNHTHSGSDIISWLNGEELDGGTF